MKSVEYPKVFFLESPQSFVNLSHHILAAWIWVETETEMVRKLLCGMFKSSDNCRRDGLVSCCPFFITQISGIKSSFCNQKLESKLGILTRHSTKISAHDNRSLERNMDSRSVCWVVSSSPHHPLLWPSPFCAPLFTSHIYNMFRIIPSGVCFVAIRPWRGFHTGDEWALTLMFLPQNWTIYYSWTGWLQQSILSLRTHRMQTFTCVYPMKQVLVRKWGWFLVTVLCLDPLLVEWAVTWCFFGMILDLDKNTSTWLKFPSHTLDTCDTVTAGGVSRESAWTCSSFSVLTCLDRHFKLKTLPRCWHKKQEDSNAKQLSRVTHVRMIKAHQQRVRETKLTVQDPLCLESILLPSPSATSNKQTLSQFHSSSKSYAHDLANFLPQNVKNTSHKFSVSTLAIFGAAFLKPRLWGNSATSAALNFIAGKSICIDHKPVCLFVFHFYCPFTIQLLFST